MRSRGAAALVVLGAFGPYVAAGIRLEQLIIYGLTVLAVLRHLMARRHVSPWLLTLIFLWAALLLLSTVSGLFPPDGVGGVPMLPGIEALTLPLCVMLLVSVWTAESDPRAVLLTVQKWTVGLMSLNAVLALVMSRQSALLPVLNQYWWLGGTGDATGYYAALVGRFGGVFNTPLNAGTAYSIAVCAALYLYHQRTWRGSVLLPAVALLVVGGFLSQSKVFILGGLPIAVVLAVVLFLRHRPGTLFAGASAALLGFMLISTTAWWEEVGGPYLATLAEGSSDPLYLYTAGRYGDGTAVSEVRQAVMDNAPVAGYGTRGPALGPLDTVWVEMLARGGLIGLGIFVLWLVALAAALLSVRRSGQLALWWTGGAMFAVAIAAAIGGPAFTQNRAGSLLLVNLLLVVAALRSPAPEEARANVEDGVQERVLA